jgi:hypothetical protein
MADYDLTLDFQSSAGATVLKVSSADESSYVIKGVALIEETRQRAVVTTPDMHGAAEVSSVLGEGVLGVVIRCQGSTWATAWSNRNTLVAAATASSWLLEQTVETVVQTWTCRAANVTNPFDVGNLAVCYVDVTLSIPVHPVPDTGS